MAPALLADDEIVDPGEILWGVVFDLDAAPLIISGDDSDPCAEDALELVDGGSDVGVAVEGRGLGGAARRSRHRFLDGTLHLADRHAAVGGFVGERHLLLGRIEAEQGTGVSHGNTLFGEQLLHLKREAEQP